MISAVNLIFVNFHVYAICRFFISASACSMMMTASLYGVEISKNYKSAPFLIWSIYSYLGLFVASGMFYFFPDWKEQMLIKLFLSTFFFIM